MIAFDVVVAVTAVGRGVNVGVVGGVEKVTTICICYSKDCVVQLRQVLVDALRITEIKGGNVDGGRNGRLFGLIRRHGMQTDQIVDGIFAGFVLTGTRSGNPVIQIGFGLQLLK